MNRRNLSFVGQILLAVCSVAHGAPADGNWSGSIRCSEPIFQASTGGSGSSWPISISAQNGTGSTQVNTRFFELNLTLRVSADLRADLSGSIKDKRDSNAPGQIRSLGTVRDGQIEAKTDPATSSSKGFDHCTVSLANPTARGLTATAPLAQPQPPPIAQVQEPRAAPIEVQTPSPPAREAETAPSAQVSASVPRPAQPAPQESGSRSNATTPDTELHRAGPADLNAITYYYADSVARSGTLIKVKLISFFNPAIARSDDTTSRITEVAFDCVRRQYQILSITNMTAPGVRTPVPVEKIWVPVGSDSEMVVLSKVFCDSGFRESNPNTLVASIAEMRQDMTVAWATRKISVSPVAPQTASAPTVQRAPLAESAAPVVQIPPPAETAPQPAPQALPSQPTSPPPSIPSRAGEIGSPNGDGAVKNDGSPRSWWNGILSLLGQGMRGVLLAVAGLVIAITVTIILLVRNAKKRAAASPRDMRVAQGAPPASPSAAARPAVAPAPNAAPLTNPTLACTKCRATLVPGANFCRQCGTAVLTPSAGGQASAASIPISGTAPVSAAIAPAVGNCTKCHALLVPGAKFCRQCGDAVLRPTAGSQTPGASAPIYGAAPVSVAIASTAENCAKCHAPLLAGAKFCRQCGGAAPVPSAEVRAPLLPQVEPNACLNCHAALPAGAKFCRECGTPMQMSATVLAATTLQTASDAATIQPVTQVDSSAQPSRPAVSTATPAIPQPAARTYHVRVLGILAPEAEVLLRLARATGQTQDALKGMLANLPKTVKKGISLSSAAQYEKVLNTCGCILEVNPDEPEPKFPLELE
jgi:ribosomal protein L40E